MSNSCRIRVLRQGLLTTVQDLGRWGYQRFGMPVSGAMDTLALRVGNRLVGNPDKAAGLEVTLQGPELYCESSVILAVTGADLSPMIDRIPVPTWTALSIEAGSTLSFGARQWGARAYVTFQGGLDVPSVMGSRSTHLNSQTGGLKGRALKKRDCLTCLALPKRSRSAIEQTVPGQTLYSTSSEPTLRILVGPDGGRFEAATLTDLPTHRFTISPYSDRMGYRLEGPPLVLADTSQLISGPTPLGAIQVPPSQQPILLMADRQTTGGYPILGAVISADLPLAAQLMPGDALRFKPVSLEEAQDLLRQQFDVLDELLPPYS